jgi:hypothetical protein
MNQQEFKSNKDLYLCIFDIDKIIHFCFTEISYLESVIETILESGGVDIDRSPTNEIMQLFHPFSFCQQGLLRASKALELMQRVANDEESYLKQVQEFEEQFNYFVKYYEICNKEIKKHIEGEIFNSGKYDYRHLVNHTLGSLHWNIECIPDRLKTIKEVYK